jgi:hypothetical protein
MLRFAQHDMMRNRQFQLVSDTSPGMFAWLPYLTIVFGYGIFF